MNDRTFGPSVLQRPVLVLNKSWVAVDVINVQKAITMVSKTENNGEPKARVLDVEKNFQLFTWEDWGELITKEEDLVIRSINYAFRVPEIILLTSHNKLSRQRVHFSRRNLFRRDNWMCQYCCVKPGNSELSIDHVLPKSQGGLTTWENCVAACTSCNGRKANRTPEKANMKLKKVPVKPKYVPFKREFICKSWEAVLGEAYWEVELENDM